MDESQFKDLLIGPVADLADRVEAIILDRKGKIPREKIVSIIMDSVDEIHMKAFVKNKARKLSKWFKRRIRGIFK